MDACAAVQALPAGEVPAASDQPQMMLWDYPFTAYRDNGTDIMPSMTDEQPTKKPRPWWHWALAAAGTAAFIVLLIWGPWWIEGHHLRDGKGQLVSSAGIIVTGFRTMLLAIAAGGFTAAGLYYTREKHRLEREQFQHTQEQFRLTQEQFRLAQDQFRQAQTQFSYEQQKDREAVYRDQEARSTEQFVTAVKLLGSTSHAERLGAIYTLKRLARDSQQHRDPIAELLDSFTRERDVLIQREEKAAQRGAVITDVGGKYGENIQSAIVAIAAYRAERDAAAGHAGG